MAQKREKAKRQTTQANVKNRGASLRCAHLIQPHFSPLLHSDCRRINAILSGERRIQLTTGYIRSPNHPCSQRKACPASKTEQS